MSRPRRFAHEDLSYSQWHRHALPELYGRRGHRFDVVDRDWSEFCHFCREPLALVETLRDIGQDIADKNVRQTVRWAELAGKEAYVAAFRVERPAEIQARIDQLEREVRRLEASYPIVGFRVQQLWPQRSTVIDLAPEEWAKVIRDIHLRHQVVACTQAPWPHGLDGVKPDEERTVSGDLHGIVRMA